MDRTFSRTIISKNALQRGRFIIKTNGSQTGIQSCRYIDYHYIKYIVIKYYSLFRKTLHCLFYVIKTYLIVSTYSCKNHIQLTLYIKGTDLYIKGTVTYRFMNEIIVTNESEWAEHMYVVFACYVLFMLLCIISFRVLD